MKRALLLVATFCLSFAASATQHRAVIDVQVGIDGADGLASATHFTAALTGNQENPAVITTASGTAVFVLDDGGLHYRITVNGLSGPFTGSHFHHAAPGANGPVVRGFTFDGNTATGVWTPTDTQPFTPQLLNALLAGNLYVNVHTQQNPGGEIRGQVRLSSGIGFVAHLSGAQEVPPVAIGATGTGAFVLDGEGLHYWITVNGLSGPITGSHFHRAAPGANGPVVRGFTMENNSVSDVWTATDAQALTTELIGDLLAGNLYVNVHTQQNPGGQIRGQVRMASGVRFVANLTGAQEVPAVATSARGTGVFSLGANGLHYRITVNGLSGPFTGSHFHQAAPGANGGVIRGFTFDGNTATGAWSAADAQALTPQRIWELLKGNVYVNVHTQQNPGGEIRGQLQPRPGVGFVAHLSSAQEVPPNASGATGTGAFILNGEGLHYWLTVHGLSGPITGSHFHRAASGSNGSVVRGFTMENNAISGVWTSTDAQPLTDAWIADLALGNLYVNVHTQQNPGGEIRGQVVPPVPGAGNLEVAFSRSIAGRNPDFAHRAITDAGGKTTIEISTQGDGLLARNANGYYMARLTNRVTGAILSTWHSIPIRGGQQTHLLLPVGGRASLQKTSALAAGKPAAHAELPHGAPRVPEVIFATAEMATDGTLTLPVHLAHAGDLSGGVLALFYNAEQLAFRHATMGAQPLSALETTSGHLTLVFEDVKDRTDVLLTFDPVMGDPGTLHLSGFIFDRHGFPILALDATTALLNRDAPESFVLHQNHPNPFNPSTQIRYALPQAGMVRLAIFNALGQEVARLVNGSQEAGFHTVQWHADGMASGIYYYRLDAAGFSDMRKMILLK